MLRSALGLCFVAELLKASDLVFLEHMVSEFSENCEHPSLGTDSLVSKCDGECEMKSLKQQRAPSSDLLG